MVCGSLEYGGRKTHVSLDFSFSFITARLILASM